MALVGYSDSEGSEDEAPKPSNGQTQTSGIAATSKIPFQKRKNDAEPHKIKITLPEPLREEDTPQESSEPASKKLKTSTGGFNAMLPAPKRTKAALASSARGKGLGPGISLKTGATPGFSRESLETVTAQVQEEEFYSGGGIYGTSGSTALAENTETAEPPKKTGSAMVFKPLSVSRKPKKKTATVSAVAAAAASVTKTQSSDPPSKPKVSLFSTPIADEELPIAKAERYKPIIHEEEVALQEDNQDLTESGYQQPSIQQAQSLLSIADSLNLSASERRQLLGRKGAGLADAKVLEFNTETEYAANEELRAKGETIKFNPVRSVAGGKHSLQQLVNLVSNQKEALEESFAAGRRNKKEAGAKYGW